MWIILFLKYCSVIQTSIFYGDGPAKYLEVLIIMHIFKNMEWFNEGVLLFNESTFVQIRWYLRIKKCLKFY